MVSKEKQIEEMAKLFCKSEASCYGYNCLVQYPCRIKNICESLYNAGYRKQNEGEWITDEKGFVTCSECGEEHTWDEFRPPYCDMCGAKMKGE